MKLLTLTGLYPNAIQPNHGIFVENRLRRLVEDQSIEAEVVAPVPWFPSSAAAFGRYADFARVPRQEERFGIKIWHPRFPVIPKIGMSAAPYLQYLALTRFLRREVLNRYDFDLIDAHYFYPDGVAAALLGRRFGKPVVITARGSDINLIACHKWPRRQMRWAAAHSSHMIAVSGALRNRMIELGMDSDRICVLRNGVDLDVFREKDGQRRTQSDPDKRPVLLSVGNLVAGKGHDLAIQALKLLDDAMLLVVGDGPMKGSLKSLVQELELGERVRFLGRVAHEDLPPVYSKADALILASAREGWPNVLLEAMACGTPVVATRVGGVPEIIGSKTAGAMVEERSPEAIAAAVNRLLAAPPRRSETRAYAEAFGWEETVAAQRALYGRVVADPGSSIRAYPVAHLEPSAR